MDQHGQDGGSRGDVSLDERTIFLAVRLVVGTLFLTAVATAVVGLAMGHVRLLLFSMLGLVINGGLLVVHRRLPVVTAAVAATLALLGLGLAAIVTGNGVHDNAIILFAILVQAATILLPARAASAVVVTAVVAISTVGVLEMRGVLTSGTSHVVSWDDVLIVAVLLVASAALSRWLVRRMWISMRAERAARVAAEQAVRARDEFLSIASHELYTPITALQLAVQRMIRQDDSRSRQRLLDLVDAQVRRLIRLVEQLLDVSRIHGGRLELKVSQVDLSALVREVAASLRTEAERAHCTVEIRADTPVVGSFDRDRVEQVVVNLLGNALKYGPNAPIELGVFRQDGHAELTVRDHGIGIPPESVERIFERFERAVSARQYGGLGLGLFIVKRIVEAHHGNVRVEAAPGQGALFTVELPLESRPAVEA